MYTPLAAFFKIVPLSFAHWSGIILFTFAVTALGIMIDVLAQRFTREID